MPDSVRPADLTADQPASLARRHLLTALGTGAVLSGADAAAAKTGARPSARPAVKLGPAVTLSRSRLDALAAKHFPLFNHGGAVSPYSPERHAARFDVDLHTLTTQTRVPETGDVVDVTGLLALPRGVTGPLPLVSWQHGTVLSFDEVPSNLTRLGDPAYVISDEADSLETLFNVHRLAGQGFAIVAADYLGKGPLRHGRGEGYGVREATVTTCIDVLDAGMEALKSLGLSRSALFLNGWSQGGLNTQWLHQALRRRGDHITASATQSPYNNLNEALRFWAGHWAIADEQTYPVVPIWTVLALIVLLGSYREYYRLPDLFGTAIKPRYQALAENYWKTYRLDPAAIEAAAAAVAAAQAHASVGDLFVEGFFERFTAESNSRFLAHLGQNAATFHTYDAPIRFYYGLADEALHPSLMYGALTCAGPKSSSVAVPRASHRETFLASLYGEAAETGGLGTVPDWFRSFL